MARNSLTVIRRELLKEFADLRLAIQRDDPPTKTVEGSIKEQRRPPQRDLKYWGQLTGISRTGIYGEEGELRRPVHDLAEIVRLQDIESYFAVSVDRHVELIMKKGYEIRSQDPDTAAWVRRRLREIELMSEEPFTELLEQFTRNLVAVSNAYFVFSRDEDRSSGRRTKMWGKARDPISAIAVPDPTSVSVRQTKSGRIERYVQKVGEKQKSWSHHDVVHATSRKKSGDVFGTPYVVPVLEDIRALRKLEMLSEHVTHKFAFPLMHWKVGNEKMTAGMVTIGGHQVPEIDIADEYASRMAQEGYVVTSERHEIKIVGAEGEKIDIQPFIDHYEGRTLAGLRMSRMDIGEGDTANRGTATVLSQILIDSCSKYQQTIAAWLTMKFLDHLVLEGGYDLTEENRVYLIFPPIDTEEERAHQNHGLQMYVQGGITRGEFRGRYMNLDDLTPEEEADMHLHKEQIPLAVAEAKARAVVSAKKGKTGDASVSRSVSNRAQPENQHKKLATSPRLPANDREQNDQEHSDWERNIIRAWSSCADAVITRMRRQEDVRTAFGGVQKRLADVVQDAAETEFHEGFERAHKELKTEPIARSRRDLHQVDAILTGFRQKDLPQLSKTCMLNAAIEPMTGLAKAGSTGGLVVPAFRSTRVMLDVKVGRTIRGCRILGYLQAQKAAGTAITSFGDEALQLKEMKDDDVRLASISSALQTAALNCSVFEGVSS